MTSLVVACTGCTYVAVDVPVRAPQVHAAADAIRSGEPNAHVVDVHGYEYPVVAASQFSGLGSSSTNRDGRWTLGQIAAACSPTSSQSCPTDDPIFEYNRMHNISGGPWLSTRQLQADRDKVGLAIATIVGLGSGVGFAYAEATCFSSWCGSGGKAAFVASDVVLGLAAVGVVLLFVKMENGLNN